MTTLLLTEIRYQFKLLRRTPDRLLPLLLVPLYTAALLVITQNAHRPDLAGAVIAGASLMGIWSSALFLAGGLIEAERWLGTLEGLVAAPAPLSVVLIGRIGTVTAVSFLGVLESALIAQFAFGVHLVIYHKLLFAAALLCTWWAIAGSALIMSGLFTLTRSIRTYQNSLSYPFYLLSGAVVPISFLPGWLQPVSRIIFLYWSADVLRSCFDKGPVPGAALRLGFIVLLGAAGVAIGCWSMIVILRRLRYAGTIGQV